MTWWRRAFSMLTIVSLLLAAVPLRSSAAPSAPATAAAAATWNVRDFGARGDGVTDDTDAIRAALAAARGSTAGFGTIYLPAGVYMVRASGVAPFTGLKLPAGSSLVGDGPDQTILRVIPGSVQPGWTAIRVLIAESNSRVAQLAIDGQRDRIDRSRIRNAAMILARTDKGTTNVTFEHLKVYDAYADVLEGFAVSADESAYVTVRDVEAFDNDGSGIAITGDIFDTWSTHGTITNVRVHHNGWQGLTFYGAKSMTASGVTAWANQSQGINVEWSEAVTIRDSLAYENGKRGFNTFGYNTRLRLESVVLRDNGAGYVSGSEIGLVAGWWRAADPATGVVPRGITQDITISSCTLTPAAGNTHVYVKGDVAETTVGAVVPHTIVLGCTSVDGWVFNYDGIDVPRVDVERHSWERYGVRLTTQDPSVVTGNEAPVAVAGADQTLGDSGGDGDELVFLDGSGSHDADGTIVTWEWFETGVSVATGADATVWLARGTHTLTLRVTDDDGAMATDTVAIAINDVDPPVVSADVTPVPYQQGWNNSPVTVRLHALDGVGGSGVASLTWSAAGAQPITSTTVSSNQAQLTISTRGRTTVTFSATDRAGNVAAPQTVVVRLDLTLPAVLSPAASVNVPVKLTTSTSPPSVPVTLSWSGSDGGSGVERYALQSSTNGGAMADIGIATPLTTSVVRQLQIGTTYRFQARTVDVAGNSSSWRAGPPILLSSAQESDAAIVYSNDWTPVSLAGSYGGGVAFSNTAGSRATFSFSGERLLWVSRTDVNRGLAEVRIDGVLVATVDLYTASLRTQQIVFASAPLAAGVTHAVEIRVLGAKSAASSGTRVDLDAFVVLDEQSGGTQPVNQAPVLNPVGDVTVAEAQTLNVAVSASDSIGDTIRLSAANLPPFAFFTDHGSGQGVLTIAPGYGDAGSFGNIRIRASDGSLADSELITISVSDTNRAPVADAGSDQTLSDADGDGRQRVTLDGSRSFDPDAPGGTIVTWVWYAEGVELARGVSAELELARGAHELTLVVTDDRGATGTDRVVVAVTDVLAPQTTADVTPVPYRDGWNDEPVTVRLRATDNTGGSGVAQIAWWTTGAVSRQPSAVAGNQATLAIDTPGATTVYFQATDRAGNVESAGSVVVRIDLTMPLVSAPVVSITQGGRVSNGAVPVTVSWSGSDADSGVARYHLQLRADGGAWADVGFADPLATSVARSLTIGGTVQFQVRAIDVAGNVGPWQAGPLLSVDAHQEDSAAIGYTGTWTRAQIGGSLGGGVAYAGGSGAGATFAFAGAQAAWVTRADKNRGLARARVDGVDQGDVDAYAASLAVQRIVYVTGQLDPAVTHTLELRDLGRRNPLSTGNRVDLDAFIVLRPMGSGGGGENVAPTLAPIGALQVNEGQSLAVAITATDAVGDVLSLSASGLPAFASFDDDGAGRATLRLSPGFSAAGIWPNISVTVSDGSLSDSETFSVTVIDVNQPPIADAGPDRSIDDTGGDAVEPVTLDGTGSRDPDAPSGSIVAWEWFEGSNPLASGAAPTVALSRGTHTLTLRVRDDQGAEGTDTVVIVVADVTAPVTTRTLAPLPNAAGWSDAPVRVTLHALDNSGGNGVASISWSASGAASVPLTTVEDNHVEFTIEAEGETTVRWYATDRAGNRETEQTLTLRLDLTLPVASPPTARIVSPAKLGASSVQVSIAWSGSDVGSGIARFQLQQSVDGGGWTDVGLASPQLTSVVRTLSVGSRYTFRVRAIDAAGGASPWQNAASFLLTRGEESAAGVTLGAGWTTQALAGTSGGSLAWSATPGASARLTFSGTQVAWVSRLDRNRGIAEVWLDGQFVATVDLYAAALASQQVVFASDGLDPASPHTLEVRVNGTANPASSGMRIDVDAFVVFGP